jgi:sentrin-specific protease 1
MHWATAVLDVVGGALHYYDSMAQDDPADAAHVHGEVLTKLLRWVTEFTELVGGAAGRIDASSWPIYYYTPEDVPQQNNSNDCGVFATLFSTFVMAGKPFDFSQADIPYWRRRLVLNVAAAGERGENLPVGSVLPPGWKAGKR